MDDRLSGAAVDRRPIAALDAGHLRRSAPLSEIGIEVFSRHSELRRMRQEPGSPRSRHCSESRRQAGTTKDEESLYLIKTGKSDT